MHSKVLYIINNNKHTHVPKMYPHSMAYDQFRILSFPYCYCYITGTKQAILVLFVQLKLFFDSLYRLVN